MFQKKYILPIEEQGESLQLAPDFPRHTSCSFLTLASLTVTVSATCSKFSPVPTHDGGSAAQGAPDPDNGMRLASHAMCGVWPGWDRGHFLVTGSVVAWSHVSHADTD